MLKMKSSRPATLKGQANQIIKQIVKVVLPSDVVQLQPGRKPKRRVKGAKKRKTQRSEAAEQPDRKGGLPPRPPQPPSMYPSVFGENVPRTFAQPAFQPVFQPPSLDKMFYEKLLKEKERVSVGTQAGVQAGVLPSVSTQVTPRAQPSAQVTPRMQPSMATQMSEAELIAREQVFSPQTMAPSLYQQNLTWQSPSPSPRLGSISLADATKRPVIPALQLPTPTPAPVPARIPAPTPAPVPARIPTPTPAPVPARIPTPTPAPVPARIPAPTPAPVPAPVPTPNQANQPSVDVDGDGKEAQELQPQAPAATFIEPAKVPSPYQASSSLALDPKGSSSSAVFADEGKYAEEEYFPIFTQESRYPIPNPPGSPRQTRLRQIEAELKFLEGARKSMRKSDYDRMTSSLQSEKSTLEQAASMIQTYEPISPAYTGVFSPIPQSQPSQESPSVETKPKRTTRKKKVVDSD